MKSVAQSDLIKDNPLTPLLCFILINVTFL